MVSNSSETPNQTSSSNERPIVGDFPEIKAIVRGAAETIKHTLYKIRAEGQIAVTAIEGYIKDSEGNIEQGEADISSEDEIEIGESDASGAEMTLKNKGLTIAITAATLAGLVYGGKKFYELQKGDEEGDTENSVE